MFYLCLAFSLLWLIHFAYLFTLSRQIKAIAKRLDARQTRPSDQ